MVLQPRMITGDDPYGLFTLEEPIKPAKDEEKKVDSPITIVLMGSESLSRVCLLDQGVANSTFEDWHHEAQRGAD